MKVVDGKIHIYDITTDLMREITPQDIESLENQAAALGFLLTRGRELLTLHVGVDAETQLADILYGGRKLLSNALWIGQGKATLSDFGEGGRHA